MSGLFRVGDEILQIGDDEHSEATLQASAVLGILAKLQDNDPTAYIRVRLDGRDIVYIFISTSAMRVNGSRFGETRLFDDKHGVSSNKYHVAACTVQTNTTVQAVAFAFMASSNGAGWHSFLNDCRDAFLSITGSPVRPWVYSIADGDGQIESAIRATDPTVTQMPCFFHFMKEVNNKHVSTRTQWAPVHNTMRKLLGCSRIGQCKSLIQSCKGEIGKIENQELQSKHLHFLTSLLTCHMWSV